MYPQIINRLIGTRIKVVAGYPGVSAINLAMERGEVNCVGGTTWSSIKSTMRAALETYRDVRQWGREGPEISAGVGATAAGAGAGADRPGPQRDGLIARARGHGPPVLAPPGVPAERVSTLRGRSTPPEGRGISRRGKANMEIKPLPASCNASRRMRRNLAGWLARAKELISLIGSQRVARLSFVPRP
jgi:hypothetical protein